MDRQDFINELVKKIDADLATATKEFLNFANEQKTFEWSSEVVKHLAELKAFLLEIQSGRESVKIYDPALLRKLHAIETENDELKAKLNAATDFKDVTIKNFKNLRNATRVLHSLVEDAVVTVGKAGEKLWSE